MRTLAILMYQIVFRLYFLPILITSVISPLLKNSVSTFSQVTLAHQSLFHIEISFDLTRIKFVLLEVRIFNLLLDNLECSFRIGNVQIFFTTFIYLTIFDFFDVTSRKVIFMQISKEKESLFDLVTLL